MSSWLFGSLSFGTDSQWPVFGGYKPKTSGWRTGAIEGGLSRTNANGCGPEDKSWFALPPSAVPIAVFSCVRHRLTVDTCDAMTRCGDWDVHPSAISRVARIWRTASGRFPMDVGRRDPELGCLSRRSHKAVTQLPGPHCILGHLRHDLRPLEIDKRRVRVANLDEYLQAE